MTDKIAQDVARRDRNIVLAGLGAIIALATACTVYMAGPVAGPAATGHDASPVAALAWLRSPVTGVAAFGGSRAFLMLFGMWAVMQVAMMSPTAIPVMLLHARIVRQRQPQRAPYGSGNSKKTVLPNRFAMRPTTDRTSDLQGSSLGFSASVEDISRILTGLVIPLWEDYFSGKASTTLFYIGYIAVWAIFSAAFAALQLGLQTAALLTPALASASPLLGGGILIVAGAFQFSALKRSCLSQCRSPIGFLMAEWRDGRTGAWIMGAKHGLHCVGCCWALMALLFVVGVMNLLWMAIITAFLLVEKLAPAGDRVGRAAGLAFIVWGVWMIAPAVVKTVVR